MSSSPFIVLGPFELQECIGKGGMGVVFKAVHQRLGVPVAVKLLLARGARAKRFRSAFKNEVRLAAGLDHPGIVRLLDYGEVPDGVEAYPKGAPYLVMELVPGASLRAWLGQLEWFEVDTILTGLLEALAHAHARGVIHRDLKPRNVLLKRGPAGIQSKLLDFGLAHALERRPSDESKGFFAGTPAYMAPEQFAADWRDFGPWTDLYSLGCLAYALVSGAPPFPKTRSLAAGAAAHLLTDPPPLRPIVAVPRGFAEWIGCLLRKEPGDRFERAADAALALSKLGEPDPESIVTGPQIIHIDDRETINFSMTGEASGSFSTTTSETSESAGVPSWLTTTSLSASLTQPRWPAPEPPVEWRQRYEEEPIDLADVGLGLYGLRAPRVIGREEHRSVLWSALREARKARTTRAVVLRGPPGCGKGLLSTWVARRAHEVGAAHILTSGHTEQPTPGQGAGGMIARFLRCTDLARDAVEHRLQVILEGFSVDDDTEWRALSEVLLPARDGEGQVLLEHEEERFGVLHRFLARVAGSADDFETHHRALVMVFDDAHYGARSMRFVRYLLTSAEPTIPVLAVLTVTDDRLAGRQEAQILDELLAVDGAVELKVGPLSSAQQRKFVDGVLHLDPKLAKRVVAHTAGSPQFAHHLLGDWVKRNLLVSSPRGYRLADDADDALPEDMGAVWRERVDQALSGLRAAEVSAVELAAVLGQRAEWREWSEVCRAAGVIGRVDTVQALLGVGLASCDGSSPIAGWAFVHALVRDAFIAHARAGGRLSEHARTCAAVVMARDDVHANERVGRFLDMGGFTVDAIRPLQLGAKARIAASDHTGADDLVDLLHRALRDAGVPKSNDDWGQCWLLRFRLAWMRGETEEALSWLDKLEAAAAVHRWEGLTIEARRHRGNVHFRHGQLEDAVQVLKLATEQAVAGPDELVIADCNVDLAEALIHLGKLDEAEPCIRVALSARRAIDDTLGIARCWESLGHIALGSGDGTRADKYYRRAIQGYDEAGYRVGSASARNVLGDAIRYRGELKRAIPLYEEAERMYKSIGASSAAYPKYNLALVAFESGDFSLGREILDQVGPVFIRLGHRATQADVHMVRAAIAANELDWPGWDSHVAEAQKLYADTRVADTDTARTAEMAARIAADAGDTERAGAAWQIAADQWRMLGRARAEAAALSNLTRSRSQ